MTLLLQYTDVDQGIQVEMAGQAPDETKRLYAINTELKTIANQYDVITSRRRTTASITPNGTAVDIGSTITDVKKILEVRYDDPDLYEPEFIDVSEEENTRRMDAGFRRNEFSQYWEDGKYMLKINTVHNETTAVTFEIIYATTNLAQNSSTLAFLSEVTALSTTVILLPERFRDLVVLGACKRLFYPSLGDGSQPQMAVIRNRYDAELKKLGLDKTGMKPKKAIRKVKLRPQS